AKVATCLMVEEPSGATVVRHQEPFDGWKLSSVVVPPAGSGSTALGSIVTVTVAGFDHRPRCWTRKVKVSVPVAPARGVYVKAPVAGMTATSPSEGAVRTS